MKGIFSLTELRSMFKDKRFAVVFIVGAAVMLFFAFNGYKSGSTEKSSGSDISMKRQAAYEAELEKRLSDILSEIDGVGELSVMVTLDSSEKTEYGKNQDMLLSVKMPQVRGVIVVCGGGDNIIVQEKVIRAVSGIFGISSAHISVIK